ncbi:MAG: helix-turn-helix domain-containing protein [Lentihominibacter sp.]|jgi:transcriptional regulator with XRE-family HTH domain
MKHEKKLIMADCAVKYFPGNITLLRRSRGYTQKFVSEQLLIARSRYGSIERGTMPSLITACMLADLYGIDLTSLVRDDLKKICNEAYCSRNGGNRSNGT